MALLRHKRETNARTIIRTSAAKIAAPVAVVLTGATVTLGVATEDTGESAPVSAAGQSIADVSERSRDSVSRTSSRTTMAAADAPVVDREKLTVDQAFLRRQAEKRRERREAAERAATQEAIENADTKLWTTTLLNLWPSSGAESFEDTVEAGTEVLVTGREADGRDEIVLDGEAFWVTDGYLSEEEPTAEDEEAAQTGGGSGGGTPSTGGTCSNGSSVPSGVSPNVQAVHNDVCANFPELTSYGTFRSGSGDHASGRAIDIMVSGERGWQVAEFVRANAGALGVKNVIYSQQIWSVERSGEGWRGMSDRGSTTANHYDHVHVSTY